MLAADEREGFSVAVCRDGDCGTAELGLYVDPPSFCRGPHLVCTCGYHKRDSHLGITHRRYSGPPGIGLPRCATYSLYVDPMPSFPAGTGRIALEMWP